MIATLALAAHLLLVGGGPLADGILDAHAAEDVVHVEADSSQPCSPGHAHAYCQICRALDVTGSMAIRHGAQDDLLVHSPGRVSIVNITLGVLPLSALGPRAPPLA